MEPMKTLTLPTERVERIPMSYETYREVASETRIMEWANGEAILHMSASTLHQIIVAFLTKLLGYYLDSADVGTLYVAPLEVKFGEDSSAREPDIFIVANDNLGTFENARFVGAPDIAIEIISRSSITIDRVDKFIEYRAAGVREYWLIDPRPNHHSAEFYTLTDDGAYEQVEPTGDGVFYSTVLPDFWLDINWLWQDELPNTLNVAAQILSQAASLSEQQRNFWQMANERN